MIRKETEPQPCPGMSIVWHGLQNYSAVRRSEAEEGPEMLGEQRKVKRSVEK